MFENNEVPGAPIHGLQEVSNSVTAMNHGLERLRSGFPLSLRLIVKFTAHFFPKAEAARSRLVKFIRSQNWIGGTVRKCRLRTAAPGISSRVHEQP